MVGKSDMTLFGWKQLIEWSIEHACMSPTERDEIYVHWKRAWIDFLRWVDVTYGGDGEKPSRL